MQGMRYFYGQCALAGKRSLEVNLAKTKKCLALFVRGLADGHYKNATNMKLVMDNLYTHSPSAT
jgi:hypothetical protein